jgi:hypothetical protein
MNGTLRHLGVWGEQTVAYHLTSLGQHVRYTLPPGVGLAALLHLLVAVSAMALLAWMPEKPAQAGAPEPSDRPTTPSPPPAPPA